MPPKLTAATTARTATKAKPVARAPLDLSDHPFRAEIETARRAILGASPTISEGIKWNSPSFRTEKDWFATINLRSKGALQIILHLGARTRPGLKPFEIDDPKGLMKWLGKDRAMLTLGKGREIAKHSAALKTIVRAWIKHL